MSKRPKAVPSTHVDRGDQERVWIELEYPRAETTEARDALGAKRAALASRMIQRLGEPGEKPRKVVWWSKSHERYCFAVDDAGSFVEAEDCGHWFRLSYWGRD